jgi:GNAT superfamily N-acetyltransferase
VIETLRGKGIGRALMAHFEQWTVSRGYRLVALATRRARALLPGARIRGVGHLLPEGTVRRGLTCRWSRPA